MVVTYYHIAVGLLLAGIKQGTFRSACLPDGYNGTWNHGGHEHRLQCVFLCDLQLLRPGYYVQVVMEMNFIMCM